MSVPPSGTGRTEVAGPSRSAARLPGGAWTVGTQRTDLAGMSIQYWVNIDFFLKTMAWYMYKDDHLEVFFLK